MAFLAMLLASIIALNQMTAQVETYDQMISAEYELMANGVALEQMEIIDLSTDYDDLEDWDGIEMTKDFSIDVSTVTFDLEIDVDWVDDNGVVSASPTDQKQIKISTSQEDYSRTLVAHTRLFSD
jgi:YbbR domain-containing protein